MEGLEPEMVLRLFYRICDLDYHAQCWQAQSGPQDLPLGLLIERSE
jgi:hypothetical protein